MLAYTTEMKTLYYKKHPNLGQNDEKMWVTSLVVRKRVALMIKRVYSLTPLISQKPHLLKCPLLGIIKFIIRCILKPSLQNEYRKDWKFMQLAEKLTQIPFNAFVASSSIHTHV